LGGFLAGQVAIQNPCTFQTLAGFNIPNTKKLRRRTKNQLGGAGVLVIEPIAGGGRMLWGKTTVSSGAPEEEEISIVFIRDQVARTVRASLRPFIGRVQSATIVPELSAGIGKLMRSMVGQGLLAGFGSITVQRNPIEPRQIDITVSIAPVSPVNWIYVNITVEL
jgi:phage tail sheath protein FI